MAKPSTCSFEGCNRPWDANGLCGGHRMQLAAGRELQPLKKHRKYRPRGMSKEETAAWILDQCVETERGCLIWPRNERLNYGLIKFKGKWTPCHRLVMEVYKPYRYHRPLIRHVCPVEPNTKCCNPDHLAWGTYVDNSRDSRGLAGKSGTIR